MVLSSIDLWQRIANEGLASPMQCRSWAAELAKTLSAADSTDGLKVLQGLVGIGKLTNYQAKILAGQSDQPLRRGPWTILRTVKAPLWTDWLEVTQVDLTRSDQTPPSWVRWLSGSDLESLRSSAPSLPRGLQLAGIQHPSLQSVAIPRLNEGELQLQVAPLAGRLLTELPASDRPTLAVVTEIMRQVADALAALHTANIVHGRIFPDRIYLADARATLACDPIATYTATLDRSAVGILGQRLGKLNCEHFLAPEFVTPGQTPSLATDVYALGCTWYWLLTGEPLASGSSTQQILAMQTEAPAKLPADLDYPEPFVRCLYHCLGKNLDARFANAVDLSAALAKATNAVAAGKKPVVKAQSTPPAAKSPATPVPVQVASPTILPSPAVATQAPSKPVQAEPAQAVSIPSVAAQEKPVAPRASQPLPTQPIPVQPVSAKPAPVKPVPAQPVPAQPMPVEPVPVRPAPVQPTPSPAVAIQPAIVSPETAPLAPTHPAAGHPSAIASVPAEAVDDNGLTNAAAPSVVRKTRRRKQRASMKWMLPVAGGCIFVMILLLVLKLSGALEPRVPVAEKGSKPTYTAPAGAAPKLVERDPRLDAFQLVAPSAERLWAPPELPQPIPLELLPPGGQLFVSFRPHDLLNRPPRKLLLAALDGQLTPLLDLIVRRTGQPLESIEQATVAFYSASVSGEVPQSAIRITLVTPKPLNTLKMDWGNPAPTKVKSHELLVSDAMAYYVGNQPLTNSQSVREFSCGPLELMNEVAELEGAGGPLIAPMEKLWQRSDHRADVSLLVSPRYLFSEGRGLLATAPTRLTDQLKTLLSNNTVAALLQSRLEPQWYIETQIIGNTDRDASQLAAQLQSELANAPAKIEDWFVSQSPHPHWRGLAIRYPQMLRMVNQYLRVGVEDGVAIANVYLPVEAASNLLVASWIAMQDGATLAGEGSTATATPTADRPLTVDEYLGRSIRLSFDQEPIEVALRLVGEEANTDLPPGSPSLRFVLDGTAFELAGITRNQQVRDFNMNGKTVREALTEIAKRGNPVTTVTDTREEDQRLLWVVTDDPESPGKQIVSLTTREAAKAANIALPVEFAP